MKKILVLDTSVYCVWLRIPGFESCGKDDDSWNYERINKKIEEEIENQSTLVLPLATIIETGNHLSQANGDRFALAGLFCSQLLKAIDNEDPWAAFSEQGDLWNDENLTRIAAEWPQMANQRISLGDATIKDVAEYYSKAGFKVEILTGDQGLKAHEPIHQPTLVPRRKKR